MTDHPDAVAEGYEKVSAATYRVWVAPSVGGCPSMPNRLQHNQEAMLPLLGGFDAEMLRLVADYLEAKCREKSNAIARHGSAASNFVDMELCYKSELATAIRTHLGAQPD